MSSLVFFNGKILPAAEARVSAFDAGFTHAAGLFETLRVYNGRIMRFGDHAQRLLASAKALHMAVDVTAEYLEQGIREVLAANKLDEARVRLTVTPGPIPKPGDTGEVPPGVTTVITAEPVRMYPPELYKQGMRVCICPYRQNRLDPLAGHKTLAYLPRLLAMKDAAERKCNESLWFNTDNRLAEGSVCNVFTVQKGVVVTPPLDTPVLPGTVRKAVIEVAKAAGMSVEERSIDINELLGSEEVFLTGSVLEIMPVTAIERHEVGTGEVGAVTRRLRELYAELVGRECGRNG
ncbi:MAG TPA: aminotransferase class IV [Phycisphaerae bacterium]|nr:aminotransferase class IV [Phycisphaerae bacterium]